MSGNSLARAFALALVLIAPVYASQILFYAGDPDDNQAIGNYINGPAGQSFAVSEVFEPFAVDSTGGWEINSLFVNEINLGAALVTEAQWSIRSGAGPGDPGRLVAHGVSAATIVASNGGATISVTGLSICLTPGQYWANIAPLTARGRLFVESTSGVNAVNSPPAGDALWYEPSTEFFAPTGLDFSFGAAGSAAPDTADLWVSRCRNSSR